MHPSTSPPPPPHTPLLYSVIDLVWRKNKEILVIVYSIPSIYKIQTLFNTFYLSVEDWGQKANKSITTKIAERFTDELSDLVMFINIYTYIYIHSVH